MIIQDISKACLFQIISLIYILHLLLTNSNQKYTIIYILLFGLISLNIFQKSKHFLHDEKNNIVNNAVQFSNKYDKILGDVPTKYNIAKVLIKNDSIMFEALNAFYIFQKCDPHLYESVVVNIFRFYNYYGKKLRKCVEIDQVLASLITQKNEIMNQFEHLRLTLKISLKRNNTKLRIIINMIRTSLNRCIRVISTKYKHDYNIAPVPYNLIGSNHELY